MRSINPTIEKINPTIPIPITSSPIPDEQREIIMAKSSIAIPNPIFFIVNPPLQIPIYCSILYSNYTIKLVNNSTATLEYMRKVRTVFCPDFLAQYKSIPLWRSTVFGWTARMMRSSRSVLLSPPVRWTTRRCWSGCGRTVFDPLLTQNPKKAGRAEWKQRKIRRANGGK